MAKTPAWQFSTLNRHSVRRVAVARVRDIADLSLFLKRMKIASRHSPDNAFRSGSRLSGMQSGRPSRADQYESQLASGHFQRESLSRQNIERYTLPPSSQQSIMAANRWRLDIHNPQSVI